MAQDQNNKSEKTITLNKLVPTEYRVWVVQAEATFGVHNCLDLIHSFIFSDITAITLITADTNAKPHLIINVYNPCDKSIIPELHEYLRNNINVSDYGIIMVGGWRLQYTPPSLEPGRIHTS